MTRIRVKRILVLALCVGFSYLLAAEIRTDANGVTKASDFRAIYYGARLAIEHKDSYDPHAVIREFDADGQKFPSANAPEEQTARIVITRDVYLPTALLIAVPFAVLPWHSALVLWLGLTAVLLVLAALAIWDIASESPVVAGCMAGFILLNSIVLSVSGNPVGIVASFCAIASWCFLRERCAAVGVLVLTVSLMLKPHDSGFVWLYFLLAGGPTRKRAVQTLAVVAALGVYAAIWIAPASPGWIQELHRNIGFHTAPGGIADPTGPVFRSFTPVIDLESVLGEFSKDPELYSRVSLLIGGGLILAWGIAVLRKPFTYEGALVAIAAISILTLLPVYHRAYDAKLLLLTIPGCAMLWAAKGATRWVALGLTAAAILVTSDFPLIFWSAATNGLSISPASLGGKIALVLVQPAPLVLLATGCFYLWVYIRYQPPPSDAAIPAAGSRVAQTAG